MMASPGVKPALHGQVFADPAVSRPMKDNAEPAYGFATLVGYSLEVWEPDYAEVVLTLERKHLNRTGVLHGGVIATLIDTACGFAGCYCPMPGRVRRAVTLSMSTNFLGQATAGDTLTAKATRTGGGRNIFFARCDLVDAKGQTIATGEAAYKYRKGSDDPNGVPA
jgi:uncharacterized protein (TIGR00369 family)